MSGGVATRRSARGLREALRGSEERLGRSEAALRLLNQTLEAEVERRTAELQAAMRGLRAEAAERMLAEDALRQAQKMEAVGQLTGGIAHDFNNMLQAIAGSLDLIQLRTRQGRAPDVDRYVATARQTVQRASALTYRLLAFGQRQALEPKSLDPGALIAGMAALIRRTVGPEVRLALETGNGAWPVRCDPNQFENALLNLCINAREAMPDGGDLSIATRHVQLSAQQVAHHDGAPPGDFVEITVSDTGTGMDERTRARAFEPFFTTKPLGQGTGLGLSQLYGFVRQSNGVVRIESAPGQGTRVRFCLPRCDEPAVQRPAQAGDAAPAISPSVKAIVLLVEDEAAVRLMVAEHLSDLGYEVVEAADGPSALRVLQDGAGRRPDVLVTDIGLPNGMNGRQLAETVRQARAGLPVLLVTGYAGGALEDQLAAGMAVLTKPFTVEALSQKLGELIKTAG
jgi:signal transduction histidine kinase/CheY-like chemotaxis protein